MALKIMTSNPDGFFSKINAPALESVAKVLVGKGVEIDVGMYSVLFKKDGKLLASANLPASSIALMGTELTHDVKEVCVSILEKAMNTVIGTLAFPSVEFSTVTLPITEDMSVPVAIGIFGDTPPAKSALAKNLASKVNTKKQSGGVIALKDATAILQKVRGTSPGSVYVAVAIGSDFNMAARFKGSAISLRIEPRKLLSSSVKAKLIESGFTEASKGHWSLHFNTEMDEIRGRILGSVISGLISKGLLFSQSELNFHKVEPHGV